MPDPKKVDFLSAYIKLVMIYSRGVDGVAILNGFTYYAIATERSDRRENADLFQTGV
ncbi:MULTISPECIES: hypothetical protein [unclassified Pseudomonas]|uniref:hypothetical protein n=1 Tax=Pseudomonas TaxID=286 RepID=UPI0018E90A20|nr:hypothetical protein [Pseudomonas sp. MF6768]MBJ2252854.1 hypothetical protein [Pseudomonas sp. MF6784]MBJ2263489.1 hypothetical protein [Pseudomonas sp. MF6787]MBK3457123.1 hypothetical protein [Pseudomonas sp. MF6754]MBU4629625.1 hypothetical protein [Pseudomonas sp. BF61]QYM70704.1 hypothetical protein K1X80_10320 [Pseudomonas sp. So3.2b]